MSVWLCIPSKRPPEEWEPVAFQWIQRGYRIALAVDTEEEAKAKLNLAHVVISSPDGYRGYARSVNALVELVLKQNQQCNWIVAAGDDTEPEQNYSADELAAQLTEHFNGTFGVCQFTGDSWGDKQGPYIQRVAGSPWLGREFCLRVNQGKGPLWPEYFHCGVDEELQAVATKLGVFWQRPDLTHHHRHWGRAREGERMAPRSRMPKFLEKANSAEEWNKYKKLFAERQAAGFPGSEPL